MADRSAAALGWALGPVLGAIARRRMVLPRFQAMGDRFGFQLRSTHYYEPTYALADLPADTADDRPLPAVDLNEAGQLALLERCTFGDELRAIPLDPPGPARFGYRNDMFGFGDAEMLYNIIRLERPARLIEIGCGQSTLMAEAAIAANRRDDEGYACEHICVEPFETPWLETLGVEVVRERVERLDLELFDRLGDGDILFIDSSHIIRPFGDVVREYHEIVPRLAPGVWVHVHDIFMPRDYPERWLREERRLWDEQYLLEAFLAYNRAFEVRCALNWLHHHHPAELHRACPMLGEHPANEPGSFWLRRRPV